MKPAAFSLSEVLIALVVIGIVAAITIPSISRASEKYILKNQFKKSYSTIVNAINKTDTDMGGNTVCYYPAAGGNAENTRSDCDDFFNQLQKNLSLQKICNGNAKADGCIPEPWLKNYPDANKFYQNPIENTNRVLNFADGTIIVLYHNAAGTWFYPLFIVDVNGSKGPNDWGKDLYIFYIISDGINGLKLGDDMLRWIPSGNKKGAYFRYVSDIYKE